jgi:hypothetical protein
MNPEPDDYSFLPCEAPYQPLTKTTLREIWPNKLLNPVIGVKNELEARQWYRTHPLVHQEITKSNHRILEFINEERTRITNGISQMVATEVYQKRMKRKDQEDYYHQDWTRGGGPKAAPLPYGREPHTEHPGKFVKTEVKRSVAEIEARTDTHMTE